METRGQRLLKNSRVDHVRRALAAQRLCDLLAGRARQGGDRRSRVEGRMGGEQHIVKPQQGVIWWRRLLGENIEGGATDPSFV